MNVKGKILGTLVVGGLILGCTAANADHRLRRGDAVVYDYARVTDVEPQYRRIRVEEPRRECWTETHYEDVPVPGYGGGRRRGGALPTIAGGVIGGVIGNQFGDGKGRDAMTLFGTLVGAAVAGERAGRTHGAVAYEQRPVDVERCEVTPQVHYEERLTGYLVTYRYRGREYTVQTPDDPGERIRVRVKVTPVVDD